MPDKKKILIIILIFLLAIVIVLSIVFIYHWWQEKKGLGSESSEGELSKLTIEDNLSFNFSDDIWQVKEESPLGWHIDGQLIHEELEKCNAWLGIDGTEICTEGEKDCEFIKGEKKTIASGDKRRLERQIWRIKERGADYILAHYDIFKEKTLFYSLELYTIPTDQQRCISDFEEILGSFRFIEE